jgi:hypothetical protein
MFEDRKVEQTASSSAIRLSGPLLLNLQVYRGDSGRFRISVLNPDGSPMDLTGATWDADIRLKANDPTTITNFDITPVAGDPSSIDVILTPENSDLLSNNCVYDVEMTLGGEVHTLIYGAITITQDVSRT